MQKIKQYLENINKKPSGDSRQDYEYAKDVIQGRWPEAEPIIMKSPYYAYRYAYYVIKGRWPEAESSIMKDPLYIYFYAKDVIGRWPEAEKHIMKDPNIIINYARDVIKGRWPEAEPAIAKYKIKKYLELLTKNEEIEFLKLYPHMAKDTTGSSSVKSSVKFPCLSLSRQHKLLSGELHR